MSDFTLDVRRCPWGHAKIGANLKPRSGRKDFDCRECVNSSARRKAAQRVQARKAQRFAGIENIDCPVGARLVPLGGTRYIGLHAIVDAADYERLIAFSWAPRPSAKTFYAVRGVRSGDQCMTHRMHREIMGKKDGYEIDHINGNGLDNRRCNLRFVSRAENVANRCLYDESKLPRGVAKVKNRYRAKLVALGKHYYLGSYLTPEEAYQAYVAKFTEIWGMPPRLN